ncbi:MAG: 4Fe-4S binding protein [Candidatus Hydrothermarchaeales archaeon]
MATGVLLLEIDELDYSVKVDEGKTTFERKSQMETRSLIFDKEKCTGCQMCFTVCPFDAIEVGAAGAFARGVIDQPTIVIDPEKCLLCGICVGACLFDALDMMIGGTSIKDSGDCLRFAGIFDFDEEKCTFKDKEAKTLCIDCEEACPTDAIKCKIVGEGKNARNTLDFDERLCIYCKVCERACDEDAIKVEKVFDGEIAVDLDKCQGCGLCVEVCPSEAIVFPKPEVGETADKLVIDDEICIYCDACVNVCPVDAIEVKRKRVKYRKDIERAWTKVWKDAFNKLADEGVEK